MAEAQKATIGRIVHFYNTSLENARDYQGINLNGQGAGPYPALVIQSFNGPYVNLIVHAYGGDWREGSVSESSEALGKSRYWVWPPRV